MTTDTPKREDDAVTAAPAATDTAAPAAKPADADGLVSADPVVVPLELAGATPATCDLSVALTLESGRKCFGSQLVLEDVSLTLHEGEVLAVIGPSGGGKSTLLRCLTLLERFDDGSLSYGDDVVCTSRDHHAVYASHAELKRARSHFGLVFQNFNLFPHMSVIRNVTDAPIHVQGRPRAEVEEEARAILAKMGLTDCEGKVPCELSGGQQQRVAIARALALRPKILFFDEPTSALDPELTQEVLRVMRGLAEENMTMVIVTHEMSFARDVADTVMFMEGGRVVESGAPEQVFANPTHERTRAFLSGMSEEL